jgi:hypothetical protein
MALPDFTDTGDLPAGVYEASLAEAVARFGTSGRRRRLLARRLERIYHIAIQTGQLRQFVVFGSFVTAKNEPGDVDIFMILDDNFDVGSLSLESRLVFDHSSAQDHFGCSIFWIRRFAAIGGEEASIEDWQIKRDGTKRGIVKIRTE